MPLFWLSLAFMAGILLAVRVQLAVEIWLAAAGGCLLMALITAIYHRRSRLQAQSPDQNSRFSISFIFLACCAFALGAARYQGALPELNAQGHIAYYNDREIESRVTGVIARPPQVEDQQTRLRLKVESIQGLGDDVQVPAKGMLQVRLSRAVGWQYGDRLQVRGHLETPPEFEDFSYREYLAQQGIYSYMGDGIAQRISGGRGNPLLRWIYAYKAHALEIVYRLWPDPEASLLSGILLGDESGIPEDVDQAFRDTGTSHIIVISGFNITIIAALLVGLFSRMFGSGEFGVRRAAVFALLGIAIYTILVGADAAVVRAAIMGSLALFATLVGRRQVGLNTLAIVAAAMAAFNPQVLWNIGFQLSFAATMGLVLYADRLKEAFERLASRFVTLEIAQQWSLAVGEYLLYTLAAQVMVLPVIIYHFQRVSLSSLLANPLILPVQPPLMMLGGLALLAGTIYFPLGQLLAWIAWPLVAYTIRVVELLSKLPGGAVSLGEVSLLLVAAFYALLFGLTYSGDRFERARSWIRPGTVLVGGMLLAVLVWRLVLAAPDGRLHMTVLDVGTGDGILVQTPGGRNLLIDGGPSGRQLSDALGRRLPPGRRQLDWLVVAAPGREQIGGLVPVLDRYTVGKVLWAGTRQGSFASRELESRLVQLGIPVEKAASGQALDLGGGSELTVLGVCQRGAILLLEWNNFRMLLPVGIDFEMLEELEGMPDLKGLTALMLAESGYAPVNPPEWVEALGPELNLLSVGAGDRSGLPSPETLEALDGHNLLRTDRNGWIRLSTDGEQLWVEVEQD